MKIVWFVVLGGLSLCSMFLTGCASLPPERMSYYFPMAQADILVAQTIGCDKSKHIVAATAVTPVITYTSDLRPIKVEGKGQSSLPAMGMVDLSSFGSGTSDADVAFNFTPDGRLAGINSTQVGEGDTVVKDAAALASAIAATTLFGYDGQSGEVKPPETPPLPKRDELTRFCVQLAALAPPQKPGHGQSPAASDPSPTVTITYSVNVQFVTNKDGSTRVQGFPDVTPGNVSSVGTYGVQVTPDPAYTSLPANSPLAKSPIQIYPIYDVPLVPRAQWLDTAGQPVTKWPVPAGTEVPDGYVALQMNNVHMLTLVVSGPSADFTQWVPLWRGEIPVPAQNSYYPLLVPKGRSFGKQQFSLKVSDYGTTAGVEYGNGSGAPALLTAAGAVVGLAPTDASSASKEQAKADVIAQSRRLYGCKTTTTCPTK